MTFADLMGLMMSFFVMLVAFSTMDLNKLKIVAGSMSDAFGVQTEERYSGIIESDGLPTRPRLKNSAHIRPEESSNTPTPDEPDDGRDAGARIKIDREFALASASLRQALQDMPELTEISNTSCSRRPTRVSIWKSSIRMVGRCSPTDPRCLMSGPAG